LLALRERHRFAVLAPRNILDVLAGNAIFGVLDPELAVRVELQPRQAVPCAGGLQVTLVPLPGKVPLYLERPGAREADPGPSYAAVVEANGRRAIIAPACAELADAVCADLRSADLLLFDGTLFRDEEMILAGAGTKTGRRVGHVAVSETLGRLGDAPGRRIFFHINNINPILLADSPERRAVEAAGFEVAHDGMEIRL
jgi:pyrroloquinoline quinone biosynthesis protein B